MGKTFECLFWKTQTFFPSFLPFVSEPSETKKSFPCQNIFQCQQKFFQQKKIHKVAKKGLERPKTLHFYYIIFKPFSNRNKKKFIIFLAENTFIKLTLNFINSFHFKTALFSQLATPSYTSPPCWAAWNRTCYLVQPF